MLRVAIRMVAEDVEGGSTLSEAMAKHPKAFDRLYTNMVPAGEAGGVLDVDPPAAGRLHGEGARPCSARSSAP